MKKHNLNLYIKIFFALLFAVVAIYFFSTQNTPSKPKIETPQTKSAIILIGTEKISLSFTKNTTFYDALIQAKNAGKISFSGKNYPGLGFFVTDIGPLHSGNGKNLIYYINGKQASVGVSSSLLKAGDTIEWKLE